MEKEIKLLIIGDKKRFYHLRHFSTELEKVGIKTKIIHDLDWFKFKKVIGDTNDNYR